MTTYMNTANARIAAQMLVSSALSAMGTLPRPAARGQRGRRRDAGGMRRRIRQLGLMRLRRVRHEPQQVPRAHAEHGEIHDHEGDQRRGDRGRRQRRRRIRGAQQAIDREGLAARPRWSSSRRSPRRTPPAP